MGCCSSQEKTQETSGCCGGGCSSNAAPTDGMKIPTMNRASVTGKIVLLRVDFNVPIDRDTNEVTSEARLRAVLPTVMQLVQAGARVVLASHAGRPKGTVTDETLEPVAEAFSRLMGQDVIFAPFEADGIFDAAKDQARALKNGDIMMLENLRFHSGEEANDSQFAMALAGVGELYINDAFSVSHRAHASVDSVADYLPSYAGHLVAQEVQSMMRLLGALIKPAIAVIGGSKISTKIGVLRRLIDRMDDIIIGGAMANTFLKAQDVEIGASLVEDDHLETARELMDYAMRADCRLILPGDVRVAKSLEPSDAGKAEVKHIRDIAQDDIIFDIGDETIGQFANLMSRARTILWNGPLGVAEVAPFHHGSHQIAKALGGFAVGAIADGKEPPFIMIGGGDTVAVLEKSEVMDGQTGVHPFSHVSTAGGAFLEFAEGKSLPGLMALARNVPSYEAAELGDAAPKKASGCCGGSCG